MASNCRGLDVHKKETVVIVEGEGISQETYSFSFAMSFLTELSDYWNGYFPTLWWKVSGLLEVSHKTDKKNFARICKLLRTGLLKGSFIHYQFYRNLCGLMRYLGELIQNLAVEYANKNTYKLLQNIKMPML